MNKYIIFSIAAVSFLLGCTTKNNISEPKEASSNTITIPSLLVNGSNTHEIVKAYRIAIGDISGNIQYHQSGVLQKKEPCLYAGLVYGKPWTRDAAINTWNGFGLLAPKVAKNTLLAQVENSNAGRMISGQYWDKIIWTIGAWNYYLYSGDKEFLKDAYEITLNTLQQLEQDEFSYEKGLFRGPAVYGDGVSAYTEIYTHHQEPGKNGSYSGIFEWAEFNDSLKFKTGYGMPMYTLSTNAVYYKVYELLNNMEKELGKEKSAVWGEKAGNLRKTINQNFWDETKGNYNYLIDPFGNCDSQEGLGISFCLLFGIADQSQTNAIFSSTVVEPAGIPCLYPTFKRYRNEVLDSYGRHSGTVWPHIQGFWADAAMKHHKYDAFLHEFNALTRHALRDFQFVEIYHPTKETPYGGIQEPYVKDWTVWFCAERQTWSATAYLRMIFLDIIGMNFSEEGINFTPFLPDGINNISLLGINYRGAILDINISGNGSEIESFSVNGKPIEIAFIDARATGKVEVEITLK